MIGNYGQMTNSLIVSLQVDEYRFLTLFFLIPVFYGGAHQPLGGLHKKMHPPRLNPHYTPDVLVFIGSWIDNKSEVNCRIYCWGWEGEIIFPKLGFFKTF